MTLETGSNVPATVDENMPDSFGDYYEYRRKLMEASGQEEMGSGLPILRINYDAEYEVEGSDPVQLKRGVYKLTFVQEGGQPVTVFSSAPLMQMHHVAYKFSAYNEKENTSDVNTTLFTTWKETVYDDMGQELSAGKYKKTTLERFPELDGRLRCQRVVYGLVTFPEKDSKDMHGNTVEVKDVPVVWYVKGSSFAPVDDAINKATKQGQPIFERHLQLGTKREKKGGTVFFVVTTEWQDKMLIDQKTFPTVMENLKKFGDTIKAENAMVLKKYDEVIRKNNKKKDDGFVDQFVSGDLSDDFQDEIPF